MRKYHETLVNAKRNKTIGNHKVEFINHKHVNFVYNDNGKGYLDHSNNITRAFTYFWTVICLVDDENKQYWLTHGGFHTRSTNEALEGYRQYFSKLGYTNMNKIPVWKYEKIA